MVTPTPSINRKIACSFSFIVNNYIKFVTLNLFFYWQENIEKNCFSTHLGSLLLYMNSLSWNIFLYEFCCIVKHFISGYSLLMKENIKKYLGLKVRSLRENAHLTQESLAAICEVSWRTISNLERGLVVPDLIMLCKIAECFDVGLDDLLNIKISRRKTLARVAEENLLIERIRLIDDKLLDYISEQVDVAVRHFG